MSKGVWLLVFAAGCFPAFGQTGCGEGERPLTVQIRTDDYGYETAFTLTGSSGAVYAMANYGELPNNTLVESALCVPAQECLTFQIRDEFGDGILAPGFIRIIEGPDTLVFSGAFGSVFTQQLACAPGQACGQALPVGLGQYQTTFDDTWYLFTPDSSGIYRISTCGWNDCDTKIWVYTTCGGIPPSENNAGTAFFNDDGKNCAPEASVDAHLAGNKPYYIRIGDNEGACPDSLIWEITYLGPVTGCMDPKACNYNPLATIADGSCIPQDDPACPEGPDLRIDPASMAASIIPDTVISQDPCLIAEGCLRGYGPRQVIRFTTRIENRGERDYFIGQPEPGNPQFTWNNCHHHFHYENYAEYLLFDTTGTRIPIGFKNGFCVLDLVCPSGQQKYSCTNMGLSAGCTDEYWADLDCQWIDVTDIPDGQYLFVTRVNWNNFPDALGSVEKNILNNWAQACLTIDRSMGAFEVLVDTTCAPYYDCQGTLYGNVVKDCTGTCGGMTLSGDLNRNGLREMDDARHYVDQILAGDLETTPCTDLNADQRITVYDAALVVNCLIYGQNHTHQGQGFHDHCSFPSGILNPQDTATLHILGLNAEENYLDIGMENPAAHINAYQFRISGIRISRVESLVPETEYPIAPRFNLDEGMVIGISYQDSLIRKNAGVRPLCRIYFSAVTGPFICLEAIEDLVNSRYERIVGFIGNGCVEAPLAAGTDAAHTIPARLFPNPAKGRAILAFPNPGGRTHHLDILNAHGHLIREYVNSSGQTFEITSREVPPGFYFFRLRSDQGLATGKFFME